MEGNGQEISRRKVLAAAGLAAVAVPLAATGRAQAASLVRRADSAGAPSPQGVHVQFGADAAKQAAVSWLGAAAVPRPRPPVAQAGAGPRARGGARGGAAEPGRGGR